METEQLLRTSSVWKLYSLKDTLLGSVIFPAHWEQALLSYGLVEFAFMEDSPIRAFCDPSTEDIAGYVFRGGLYKLAHIRGAVQLYGISIEQFEKMPGCTFIPGAGYLRSLVE